MTNIDFQKLNSSKIRNYVERIQCRIYRASKSKDFKTISKLQDLILRSHSTKILTIWTVTHINTGKKTAGVDKFLPKNNEDLNML